MEVELYVNVYFHWKLDMIYPFTAPVQYIGGEIETFSWKYVTRLNKMTKNPSLFSAILKRQLQF
jgi:hypothetical protein